MIIDLNASLGHYPFRALRHNTAESLVQLMDRSGVNQALVTSLTALFYRDAHRGNEELFAMAALFPQRLLPVATINPRYVGWERDLTESLQRGARALTLVPEYHGYALNDAHGRAALDRVAESGLPLVLRQRFEDRRQRHAWDQAEDLSASSLLETARAYPKMRFILVNWAGLDGARLVDAGLRGRCLIDLARLQVVFRQEVPRLMETMGAESIGFGSHVPFDYMGGSLVKLENVQRFHPEAYTAIAGGNAARFLRP